MAEIVTCPACDKKLQVPEDFFGKTVQCPECKQTFLATQESIVPRPVASAATPPGTDLFPSREKPPSRAGDREEDDEDLSHKPRSRNDDEDDQRSRPRRHLTAHRGGMILAFGIIGLVMGGVGLIFGPIAWFMGNADLREMRAGRMDPSGESQTNTGRILGMIATLLHGIGAVVACLVVGGMILIGGLAGMAGHQGGRRR